MSFGFGFSLPAYEGYAAGFGPSSFGSGASLALDFLNGNNTLSPLITFSRTTNATLTGSNGLIQNAPMNLLTFSEQFNQSPWDLNSTATVTANSTTAPEGTSTADTLFENANTSAHYVRTPTFSFVSGSSYAFSVFAKNISGGRGFIQIAVFAGFGSGANVTFNLSTGSIEASTHFTGSISPVGNGWYRCVAVGTATSPATERMTIALSDGTTTSFPSYAGDITKGIFIWGAQLELGSTATTYNPTTVKNLLGFTENFDNAAWTKSNAFVQTNLVRYSEEFDNAAWSILAGTLTTNAVEAPDGTMTAESFATNTANARIVNQTALPANSIVSGNTYTMSIFAKNVAGSGVFKMYCAHTAAGFSSDFTATSVWQRFTFTFTANSTGNDVRVAQIPTAGDLISFWGAQIVQGATPGDYKATYAAAAPVGYTDIYGQPFAQKLVENTANASHATTQNVAELAGTPYTYTAYAKAGERTLVALGAYSTVGNMVTAVFDLATGTVATPAYEQGNLVNSQSSAIVSIGDGWYRCSITYAATFAQTTSKFIAPVTSAAVVTDFNGYAYTGDGTSGIYIFGAQLSDSASVDPYVYQPVAAPTSTAYYGPRFDYDPVTLQPKGLLIEEQRTNLLAWSEQLDNAAWVKAGTTVTANSTVSPDGTVNADKLVEDTSTGIHTIAPPEFNSTTGTTYTYSFYAKAAERNIAVVFDGAFSGNEMASFNLSTGVATVLFSFGSNSASMTAVGNGWYRCVYTETANSTLVATRGFNRIRLSNGTTTSYTGVAGSGLFIWGAQLEAGAFATSYIPTVASQVTRAADNASMIGNNFARWYNQTQGAFMVEGDTAKPTTVVATAQLVTASDGTANNSHRIRYITAGIDTVTIVGGATQVDTNEVGYTVNVPTKVAYAYLVNDYGFTVNGGAVQTVTSATVPVVNSLQLGGFVANATPLNGHLRRFAYYPRRLANTELQAITS